LRLTGRVRSINDGRFTVQGPVFTGMQVNLGRTVVFDTGPLVVVVSEDRVEALDPQQFRLFGLEPTRFRYIILKSKVQYRPAFMPLAKAAIDCNGAGVASLDLESFEWRKLRRPTFPLDRSNA
jgi:microcystin degradation protein MlrC